MAIFGKSTRPTSGSPKTIRVEFVDGADNSLIGVSDMLPDQLPDTFAIDTSLDIKDQKWSVQKAEPVHKSEFLKTGRLRLVLWRITMGVPADILFSLPTISDDIGSPSGNTIPNEKVFALHEDDWRQTEFVSAQFESEIAEEFADIRQIWDSKGDKAGFEKVHVRKRIPEPMAGCALGLDGLRGALSAQKRFDAVGFLRTAGTIPQSFAWVICENLTVWGIADADGKVLHLCLSGLPGERDAASVSAALGSLTEPYALHFVDWCRMTKVSDATAFKNYFQSLNR